METRASLLAECATALSLAGFEEPRRHARRLVAAALAISPADLFGDPGLADTSRTGQGQQANPVVSQEGHDARHVSLPANQRFRRQDWGCRARRA